MNDDNKIPRMTKDIAGQITRIVESEVKLRDFLDPDWFKKEDGQRAEKLDEEIAEIRRTRLIMEFMQETFN